MQSSQIVLANEPRLLRSMLHRVFVKMPALEVAGEVNDLSGLSSLIEETEVDWVIVSLSDEGKIPDSVQPLFAGHPSVGIVGMARDGSLIRIQRGGQVENAPSGLSLDQLTAVLLEQPALSASDM
jgi:hypothetical protein